MVILKYKKSITNLWVKLHLAAQISTRISIDIMSPYTKSAMLNSGALYNDSVTIRAKHSELFNITGITYENKNKINTFYLSGLKGAINIYETFIWDKIFNYITIAEHTKMNQERRIKWQYNN